MPAGRIMVVEDDARIAALVVAYLEREGYGTLWVTRGEDALAELRRHELVLIVLDVGLPGIDGFEVCRRVGGAVPVIMLTARDEEADRIAGLEVGADDYVVKPFSPREVVARVKAVLRRGERVGVAAQALRAGDVELRPDAREASVDGEPIHLTQREFDLLAYLMAQPGRVVTRDELLEAVWGFRSPGQTRTVDVHVAQLRARIGRPELIQTVRGVGYKLVTG